MTQAHTMSEAHAAALSTHGSLTAARPARSALARLVALDGFVDDIQAPTTADDPIVTMALSQRFDGVSDLHCPDMPRIATLRVALDRHLP